MSHIRKIETSFFDSYYPYLYTFRFPRGELLTSAYVGYTPTRRARFLQITLAMARRYEASVTPARIGQP